MMVVLCYTEATVKATVIKTTDSSENMRHLLSATSGLITPAANTVEVQRPTSSNDSHQPALPSLYLYRPYGLYGALKICF